jgi:hypothetical protein
MGITQKSTKILWANAAGRCSFAGCQKKLFKAEDDGIAPYTVGETSENSTLLQSIRTGAAIHRTPNTSALKIELVFSKSVI